MTTEPRYQLNIAVNENEFNRINKQRKKGKTLKGLLMDGVKKAEVDNE